MNQVVPVILCGGSGTRLWPLSRAGFPKRFLVLSGATSLFQQAVERVNELGASDIVVGNTLVVTNEERCFLSLEQVREIKSVNATLLLEPNERNTAPALTLAALQATENGQVPTPVVTPADQTVQNSAALQQVLQQGIQWSAEEQGITMKFEGQGLDEAATVAAIKGDKAPGLKVGDVVVKIDPRFFRPAG